MSDHDLDALRDREPRVPGAPERESVAARARALRAHARRRRISFVAACVVVVVAGASGAVAARSDNHPTRPTVSVHPTVAPPLVVDTRCFPAPIAGGAEAPAAVPVKNWSSALPRLLVLDRTGDLWVIDHGIATLWAGAAIADGAHSAYVWARWAADGTIWASRVGAHDVELDHLVGPRPEQRSVVATLPYTVKADAPAGYCPINGYLASFGITAHGFVLVHQTAGPIPHSCPAPARRTAPTTPWRCASPAGFSPEIRTNPARTGTPTGDFFGGGAAPGYSTIDSSHPASDTVVMGVHSLTATDLNIETFGTGPLKLCCAGGENTTAAALSADSRQLVYASGASRGTDLRIATARIEAVPSTPDHHLWTAPDRITAVAASSFALAVGHGSAVSLVSLDGRYVSTLDGLPAAVVTTLDWDGSAPPR